MNTSWSVTKADQLTPSSEKPAITSSESKDLAAKVNTAREACEHFLEMHSEPIRESTNHSLSTIQEVYTDPKGTRLNNIERAILERHGSNPNQYSNEVKQDFQTLQYIKRILHEQGLLKSPDYNPSGTILSNYGLKRTLESKLLQLSTEDISFIETVKQSVKGENQVSLEFLDIVTGIWSTAFNAVVPNAAAAMLIADLSNRLDPKVAVAYATYEAVTAAIPLSPSTVSLFRLLTYGIGGAFTGMTIDFLRSKGDTEFTFNEFKRRFNHGKIASLNVGYGLIPILNLMRKSAIPASPSLRKVLYVMTAIGNPILSLEEKYVATSD
ncbi:MAG: hypothetical protein Fur003_0430 [Candidatus Dojkabacteria bacterium]